MDTPNLIIQNGIITYEKDSKLPFHLVLKSHGWVAGVYKASSLKLDFARFRPKNVMGLHVGRNASIGVVEGDCIECVLDNSNEFGFIINFIKDDKVIHHCVGSHFVINI